jgi:hypothetical protein
MSLRRSAFLEAVYDAINQMHFGGKLPSIPVGWDSERFKAKGKRGNAAETDLHHDNRNCRISFNPRHRVRGAITNHEVVVLIHEMLHVKLSEYQCNSRADLHGKRFRAERQRLIDAGAFTELL